MSNRPRSSRHADDLHHTPLHSELEARDREERQRLRRALGGAVLFHLGLLAVTLPSLPVPAAAEPEPPKAYVVEAVRYRPAEPPPESTIPEARRRRVPIPDPTPDDPEPLFVPEPATIELPDLAPLPVAIPAPPPDAPREPLLVTAGVEPPVRRTFVAPEYTEIARRSRITGVVKVEAIIDEAGNVTEVTALRGLPMGLTEAAVEAVRRWTFEPARLDGRPVAVRFHLTVRFTLH